jgi:DNA polymerase III subunit epsilon
MLDWIKNINKDYPDFYKEYLKTFQNKSNRYVVLVTETSGLNPKKDVVLSFGAIGLQNDVIKLNDVFEVVILQYKYLHDNGLPNDFIIESSQPKMAEPQAIESLLKYIGNATLVGHRIHFDIQIINEVLHKMGCGKIKNEALDVEMMHKKLHEITTKQFSLDVLLKQYKVNQDSRNKAVDDAFSISLLFLKLKSRLGF